MNIPRDFIDLLLARIDLVDLINIQLPLRKKSGNNYFARCPFHTEKSASFSVSQLKQFFYCFGCGAHGNAIDFVMQHDRLSFPDAVEMLARHIGMEVPQEKGEVRKNDSLPALYDLVNAAAVYYYDQMRQSNRAVQYLKNRGITGAIAKLFQVGYAENGWHQLLQHLGSTDADKYKLLQAGLIIKKSDGSYYDRFRDRIIFPIHDYRGRIIGFGGRIIDQGEPKYLNSPETPLFQKGHELYGLHQVLKANRKLERVILVEGYMDVIALFQHGINYAVATLGTATTSHHLDRLSRYTSDIVFSFDGDKAGETAAFRALQVIFPMMDDHMQIRFLFLPNGEDPDSLVRKEGKVNFENRLQTALPLSTFFLNSLSTQCDMSMMEGRARFANLALEWLKKLPANLFRNLLLEELSKRSRIELTELKGQLARHKQTQAVKSAAPDLSDMPPLPVPMRLVLSLLIKFPQLLKLIPEHFSPSSLTGALFLQQLIDIIQNQPNITTGGLFECYRGKKEADFMVKLANLEHNIPKNGLEGEFTGALRQLTQLTHEQEINRLLAKAAKEELTDEEKLVLSAKINHKKSLINQQS